MMQAAGEFLGVVVELLVAGLGIFCLWYGFHVRDPYAMAFGATWMVCTELSGIRRKVSR